MSSKYSVAIFLLICSANEILSTPLGAPTESCESMTPAHDAKPSADPCPFETLVDEDQIFSNESLTLTLQSKSTTSTTFRGFLIMAFDTKTDKVVGTFRKGPNSSNQFSQSLDCYETYDSASTHNSADDKSSVILEWIPPAEFEGEVVFRTTYVQTQLIFWVKETSNTVNIIRVEIPTTTTIEPPTTEKVELPDAYEGCGISKSCVATPNECVASKSCSLLTTYKQVDDHLEMEIYGQISNDQYIATGFSPDGQMGDDSVVECVYYRGVPSVYQSYNVPEKDNQRQSEMEGFDILRAAYSDGRIYCQIEHPVNFTVNDIAFDLKQPHYLLLASGPTSGAKISRHTFKGSSGSALDFYADQPSIDYLAKESRVLKQLHGSFMVIAWLIAASIGVFMPRYMKKTWVGKQFMGKDMWFVYHRGLMVFAWTLTVAAFIIIFVDVDGWVSESISENPHPLIGCITTVLAFIQPFMAALRPEPDAPKRYIFNWAHLLVGHSAHILAITTIFLAVEMEEAELRYETYWILTTHICVYVVTHLVLTILERRNSNADYKLDVTPVDQRGSFGRKVILVAYICIVTGLGFTVVAFIAETS